MKTLGSPAIRRHKELGASSISRGESALGGGAGGGDMPPAGFGWLTDFEGNSLYDADGVRLYGAI